jgi:tetratricopeptide (TPR) repeat protein
VALRLLDLTLEQFIVRKQSYLFLKWTGDLENLRPGAALGMEALAWRAWMHPAKGEAPLDLERLDRALEGAQYEAVWRTLFTSFPNDVSGVLALRLAGAKAERDPGSGLPRIWVDVRSASPETGLAAFVNLMEGLALAERGAWAEAVDSWLAGIEHHPLEWEMSAWLARVREGLLLHLGESVQAGVLDKPSAINLKGLRLFRSAAALERSEDLQGAFHSLEALSREIDQNPDQFHPGLAALARTSLSRLRIKVGEAREEDRLLTSLETAEGEELQSILSQCALPSSATPSLAARFLDAAQLRLDRNEVPAAMAIWRKLAEDCQDQPEMAAPAFSQLLSAHWKRLAALEAIASSNTPLETEVFQPLGGALLDQARADFETQLQKGEDYAQRCRYSKPAMRLALLLYDLNTKLGQADKPHDLLVHLARSATPSARSVLAKEAQRFRPGEAVAILEMAGATLAEASPSSRTPSPGLLHLLEEQNQFERAAEIARALAEAASGTSQAGEAWFKAASLEYKAADYPTAEKTLEDLLNKQSPQEREYAQTAQLLAKTRFHRGDYPRARDLFDQLMENQFLGQKEREDLALLKVNSLLYSQDYDEAMREIEKFRSQNPSRSLEHRLDLLADRLEQTKPNP